MLSERLERVGGAGQGDALDWLPYAPATAARIRHFG
jgi:hypothetical protein